MPNKICPECGNIIDYPEDLCTNPDCPFYQRMVSKGLKLPTHGWVNAIIFAIVLAVIAAVVLTYLPSNMSEDESGDNPSGIVAKIEKITSGESEAEIILAQGSTEAPPDVVSPTTPGGLDWERLRYPDSERLVRYFGKKLKADEQAYITYDDYDDVKTYYTELIKEEFFKEPQMLEVINEGVTKLTLQNQTGSLSVWVTATNEGEKVYILVTKLENLADKNLKPFGGPRDEQKKGTEGDE